MTADELQRTGPTIEPLTAIVNGEAASLSALDPATTALDWLRGIGLTGAKEGCAEGECGACSVMVLRPTDDDTSRWTAINACLIPAASLDGQEVITAEGLGEPSRLHPVQREMALRGGSQCGYCTPGFICSMAAEYYRPERAEDVADADSEEHGANGFDLHALSGNLCRCTGYRPIRDAAYALNSAPEAEDPLAHRCSTAAPAAVATRIQGNSGSYVRPTDLAEVFELLAAHPDALLLAGATDWGVEVNIRGRRAPFVIGIDRVEELRTCDWREDHVEIGAALTLSELEARLAGRIPLLAQLFPQFASRLIRNGATIGGNLGTGSPIGDTPPALLALDASVVLAGAGGERDVPLAEYFTGYRETVRRDGELIRAVRIPLPLAPVTAFHKIAKRRFDDISSVAVGFALDVHEGLVTRARIGLGGVAATPIRGTAAEAILEGRPWTEESVRAAAAELSRAGTPMDDHRASASYRSAMLGTALLRLYHQTTAQPQLNGKGTDR